MGNQILQLIHLYASALEFRVPIYRIGKMPEEGFKLSTYPHVLHLHQANFLTRLILKVVIFRRSGLIGRGIRKLISFLPIFRYTNMNLLPEQCVDLIRAESKRLRPAEFKVWAYYHFKAVYKWQDSIREHIQFSPERVAVAEQYLRGIGGNEATTYVGVHMRRTDYKQWLDGRYYYPLALYRKLIRQAASCLPGKLKFIIFSDECFSSEDLDATDLDLSFSRNDAVTDYIVMSRCHYLIGPPSTFSGTASFLGKARKFTIYSADSDICSADDFGVVGIDYETAPSLTYTEDSERKLRGYVKLKEGKIISIHTPA